RGLEPRRRAAGLRVQSGPRRGRHVRAAHRGARVAGGVAAAPVVGDGLTAAPNGRRDGYRHAAGRAGQARRRARRAGVDRRRARPRASPDPGALRRLPRRALLRRLRGAAAVLLVQRAKPYYLTPIYPVLFGGGAVLLEGLTANAAVCAWRPW